MRHNYRKMAAGDLSREKTFSLINITGLSA
jgi:hypothetical protein